MKVLGIHTGHDSSAALIVDGKIVADVAEERFSRIKHDAGLPLRSIDYCLKSQKLTMADIDCVAVPASSSVPGLNDMFDLKGERREPLPPRQALMETLREWLKTPGLKPPLYFKHFPAKETMPIVHADRTPRPQTVNQNFNRRFWNLINEFAKLTGEYLLLNTSFNIMGEPIVRNPREAIRCFYDNGLDVMVMDNFVLEKQT